MRTVGTLLPGVHSHCTGQRVSLSDCHLPILHYQRNTARLQQLNNYIQAYRHHLSPTS
jgi:hypothetical protein